MDNKCSQNKYMNKSRRAYVYGGRVSSMKTATQREHKKTASHLLKADRLSLFSHEMHIRTGTGRCLRVICYKRIL